MRHKIKIKEDLVVSSNEHPRQSPRFSTPDHTFLMIICANSGTKRNINPPQLSHSINCYIDSRIVILDLCIPPNKKIIICSTTRIKSGKFISRQYDLSTTYFIFNSADSFGQTVL
ncbi:hypothetical protein C4J98_0802 [Pseudomonas orientalis]|nr:hypothetical protein C4J98_0802 [Pseudomonas orientalis]